MAYTFSEITELIIVWHGEPPNQFFASNSISDLTSVKRCGTLAPMVFSAKIITVFVVLLMFCEAGVASDESQKLSDLLRAKINAALDYEHPENSQFKFSFFQPKEQVSENEIGKLEELAKSDPNASARLERTLSENDVGGSRQIIALYYGDSSKWRTSQSLTNSSLIPYTDMAKNGRSGYWSLTSRHLQKMDDLGDFDRFNPELYYGLSYTWTRSLISGIPWGLSEQIEIKAIDVNDDRAFATVGVSGVRFRVEFDLADSDKWGSSHIVQVDALSNDSDAVSARVVFGDWRYSDLLNRNIAHTQRIYDADGLLQSELILEPVRKLEFDIDQLVKTPEPSGIDPIRGENIFTSITDYSSSTQSRLDENTRELLSTVQSTTGSSPVDRFVLFLLLLFGAVLVVLIVNKRRK